MSMSIAPLSLSFAHKTPNMRPRAFWSGIPSDISRSNRPARRSAGSWVQAWVQSH